MAQIIRVDMKRANSSGIVCTSSRPIVIWGEPVTQAELDSLENTLSDMRQLYSEQSFGKTQSDIIREVCDRLFTARWDFASQGGTIEF